MTSTSILSKWVNRFRARGTPSCKLLVCIYTCEAHDHLLERFYTSEVGALLLATPDTRVLEVHADAGTQRSHLDGRRMVLRANEGYPDLPLKTWRMIEFCVREFRFENLVKIDITTVLTQSELGSPEYSERKALDMAAIAGFLGTADYARDYLGFILHELAARDGAENWARKKGLDIDYARLFGDGPMPPYYTGKCYVISRRFAEFIARFGSDLALEHQQYFPGSEDVMVGRMHQRFKSAHSP